MLIADKFTVDAFRYEWNLVLPTPENWGALLHDTSPDALFIESAWEGNDGSWKYHLVGETAPRPAIRELIAAARSRGIPVAFWNKEDPPHFLDFLPLAQLVDIVFTTDGDVIPRYREALGHERIYLLPFAAQPAIHNPARIDGVKRDRQIVFGGMYFRDKYPERKSQMDFLLPAASKFRLDIFSRQHGGDGRYQFPTPYDRHVRGALTYPEMISAYHAYRVVLNVNSVVNSRTMCARRIFEATACGAAVVSPPSPAIAHFFPSGQITIASNEDEASLRMKSLLRSDEYRDRLVHLAQRSIWEGHTYAHRAAEVEAHLALPRRDARKSVSIIVSTIRPSSVVHIVDNIKRQLYRPLQLVVASHGFEIPPSVLRELVDEGIDVRHFATPPAQTLGENLNALVDAADGDYILRMDDDDWYGPHYVGDTVNALEYSSADLVGKASTYIYFQAKDATILTYAAHEHRFTDFVRGATFAGHASVFKEYRFADASRSEDSDFLRRLSVDNGKIYSADRFNFVVNRWADKSRHTWHASDEQLFASGEMKFRGNAQDQVEV